MYVLYRKEAVEKAARYSRLYVYIWRETMYVLYRKEAVEKAARCSRQLVYSTWVGHSAIST
jgi:hypothetical protein